LHEIILAEKLQKQGVHAGYTRMHTLLLQLIFHLIG